MAAKSLAKGDVEQTGSVVPNMPSTEMASLLLESSPELAAVDTAQRGWTEMTLTPEAMTSQWRFVSDVALPTYTTTTGPLMQCRAGARKLS